MSMNYTQYVARILGNISGMAEKDFDFAVYIPTIIEYAEQRIYRELDLLVQRVINTAGTVTENSQLVTLSTASGTFVVVEQMNIISPSTATATTGSRTPLIAVTKEFINAAWPGYSSNTGTPLFFAPVSNTTFLIAPAPSTNFPLEVVGTVRPAALSATNTTTFLTDNLPDLFVAASMVYVTGAFSNIANTAMAAPAWEEQYKMLAASANIEELRKRFMGPAWQPMTPSPVATPPRV